MRPIQKTVAALGSALWLGGLIAMAAPAMAQKDPSDTATNPGTAQVAKPAPVKAPSSPVITDDKPR